jgi:hypothetical protein
MAVKNYGVKEMKTVGVENISGSVDPTDPEECVD